MHDQFRKKKSKRYVTSISIVILLFVFLILSLLIWGKEISPLSPLYMYYDTYQQNSIQRLSAAENKDNYLSMIYPSDIDYVELVATEDQRLAMREAIEQQLLAVYIYNPSFSQPDVMLTQYHHLSPCSITPKWYKDRLVQFENLSIISQIYGFICLDGSWTDTVINFTDRDGDNIYRVWYSCSVAITTLNSQQIVNIKECFPQYFNGDNNIIGYMDLVEMTDGSYAVKGYMEMFLYHQDWVYYPNT